jgi:hypothetical protein
MKLSKTTIPTKWVKKEERKNSGVSSSDQLPETKNIDTGYNVLEIGRTPILSLFIQILSVASLITSY